VQEEKAKHERAAITAQLLQAHTLLAAEVDGLDPMQVWG
jgi:hypothetical protein